MALWIIIKPYLFASRAIRLWAKDKNYHVKSKQLRFIRTGPYSIISGLSYRPVYRVDISKNIDQLEKGWIKIGGIISENVSIIWDSDLENPPNAVKIFDTLWILLIIGGMLYIVFSSIKN